MKMELEIMKQYLIWICNFSMGNVRKLRINNELPVGADEGSWLSKMLFDLGLSDVATENGVPENKQVKDPDKASKTFPKKDFEGKKVQLPPKDEILPPDIGDGLGRNQAKRDINSLAQFVRSKAIWMVNRNELYIFDELYWKKLGLDDAIRYIRDICSEYQEFAEVLTPSEHKKIYSDLLHDPELNVEEDLTSPPGVVNFNDGEIDFLGSPLYIQKHNPAHHFMSHIDVSAQDVLKPPADGITFERFANHISGGNKDVRTQLLELLAIALTGVQLKKFYVLLGPSNSGKTQWGRFMEELLGRTQVETVRGIHDFGDRWTVGSLVGKRLATCLDLPDKVLPSAAVGIIKQFCGDDPVKGEVKYASSFTYYQKPLLLFAGNHPIRLANAHREDAFWNRMIVIPFANTVREEDMERNLYEKLLNEAPYIIHEAIMAYQELAERNFVLTRTEVPMEYQQDGIYGYDSIRDFIRCNIEEQEGTGVTTRELYDIFCAQTEQEMSMTVFSRALAAAVQDLFPQARQVKRVNKTGDRGYTNLKFVSNA